MTTTTSNQECPICAADIGPSEEFFWHDHSAACWPLRDPVGQQWKPESGVSVTYRPNTPRRTQSSSRALRNLDIHSYADASQALGTRQERRIANNTWLIRGQACIMVRFHATSIVTYWHDGRTELRTGGWHTKTTRARLSRFAPQGYTVWAERKGYTLANLHTDERALFTHVPLVSIPEQNEVPYMGYTANPQPREYDEIITIEAPAS